MAFRTSSFRSFLFTVLLLSSDISVFARFSVPHTSSRFFVEERGVDLVKRDGAKYVFMHHIVGNTYDYDQAAWNNDVASIAAKGVDAIALNIGTDDWEPQQIAYAYNAVESSGTNLKAFISFDFTATNGACDITWVTGLVNTYKSSSGQFNYNSQPFVSSYEGGCLGNSGWQSIKDQTGAYTMPFISGLEGSFDSWPAMDSWYCWGCAWPQGDYDINTDDDNYYLSQLGSRYATTVSPWFFTHYTYKNQILLSDDWLIMTRWEELIAMRSSLTFVEMVTWNDFGESDYFGPIEGDQPTGTTWATSAYDHTAFFNMSQYYISYFKTGTPPAITQDVIYYWARPHPWNAVASGDSVGEPDNYSWTQDYLWVGVFATASAQVTLTSGTNSQTFNVNAGTNKLQLALSPGFISVSMIRNGQTIINKTPTDYTFIDNPVLYNFNAYVGSATV